MDVVFRRFYQKNKKQIDQFDGLLVNNTVLERGLVIAPVIAAANTLQNGLVLGMSFMLITFFAVVVASFVPKALPYAIRVILYVIVAGLLFIPVSYLMDLMFPGSVFKVGIFLPLLITNSLIVTKTETRFLKKKRLSMMLDVFSHVLGFFVVIVLVAALRELLGNGTLMEHEINIPLKIYGFMLPFGGFILLGFLAAGVQRFRLYLHGEPKARKGGVRS
ncbi:Rnf-Nqr domain containing protein [Massiliimalia timonensis]|uniref:Rnf-Nqr domain containing protein n=1 Tax=Massiliimalia timonensis TaxID=1987501 RepID=UPI00189EB320|nr:Rnf-Nqr domain containing protein [Massiliimalia timonensis]